MSRIGKRVEGIQIAPSLETMAIGKARQRGWLLPEEPDLDSLTVKVQSKRYEHSEREIRFDKVWEVTKELYFNVELVKKPNYDFPLTEVRVAVVYNDRWNDEPEDTERKEGNFSKAKELINEGDILELIFSRVKHNDIVILNVLREVVRVRKIKAPANELCYKDSDGYYDFGPVYSTYGNLTFGYAGEGIEIVVLSKGSIRLPFCR